MSMTKLEKMINPEVLASMVDGELVGLSYFLI